MSTDPSEQTLHLEVNDREPALAFVRGLLPEPGAIAELRSLIHDENAPATLSEWEDEEVLEAVAHRIAAKHLALAQKPRTYRSAEKITAPERPTAEPVLIAPTEITWIEIQLVDEQGEPVKGARYELTLPDGSVQRGKLNFRGRARVDDIEQPGACSVSFPDLDGEAWDAI